MENIDSEEYGSGLDFIEELTTRSFVFVEIVVGIVFFILFF